MTITIARHGEPIGSYSPDELDQALLNGTVSADTDWVSPDGSLVWVPVASLADSPQPRLNEELPPSLRVTIARHGEVTGHYALPELSQALAIGAVCQDLDWALHDDIPDWVPVSSFLVETTSKPSPLSVSALRKVIARGAVLLGVAVIAAKTSAKIGEFRTNAAQPGDKEVSTAQVRKKPKSARPETTRKAVPKKTSTVPKPKQREVQRASLVKCPTCSAQVSSQAESCPHCGHPLIESRECIACHRKKKASELMEVGPYFPRATHSMMVCEICFQEITRDS